VITGAQDEAVQSGFAVDEPEEVEEALLGPELAEVVVAVEVARPLDVLLDALVLEVEAVALAVAVELAEVPELMEAVSEEALDEARLAVELAVIVLSDAAEGIEDVTALVEGPVSGEVEDAGGLAD